MCDIGAGGSDDLRQPAHAGMVLNDTYYRESATGNREWINPADVEVQRDARNRRPRDRRCVLIADGQPVQSIGPGSEKMSKSKNNGVDPQGDGRTSTVPTPCACSPCSPRRRNSRWSGTKPGVEGMSRFLRRLWKAVFDQVNAPPPADAITTYEFDKTRLNAAQKEMRRIAHSTLAKVTDDIGRRRSFNTAVAAVMELLNAIGQVRRRRRSPAAWSRTRRSRSP